MKIFNEPPIVGRSCGDCTACCNVMGVPELKKGNYTNCEHQCAGGCGIYNQRPKACEDFECLWLSGRFGRDEDRPDKLGVIVVAHNKRMGRYELMLTLWLMRAIDDKLRYLIRKVAAIRVIAIRTETTFELLGERRKVVEVERAMKLNPIETTF